MGCATCGRHMVCVLWLLFRLSASGTVSMYADAQSRSREQLSPDAFKDSLVWGVFSCPSHPSSAPASFYMRSGSDRAAVHCCRDTVNKTDKCQVPQDGNGCQARATFLQAEDMCKSQNMRLCSRDELLADHCCSQCGGNKSTLVWSSTPVRATKKTKGSILNQDTSPYYVDAPIFDKHAILCKLKSAIYPRALNYHLANDFTHVLPSLGSCALVSSSGVLNYHSHGEDIDRADSVIRFNDAPVDGFESMVGSKTTLRIVNEKILEEWVHPEHAEIRGLDKCKSASGCDPVGYVSTCTICNVGTFKQLSPDGFHARENDVLAMNRSLHLYSSNLGMEKTLEDVFRKLFNTEDSPAGVTTGSIGMALALSMCDSVKAYGLAMSPQTNKDYTPYHYYDKDTEGRAATENWHKTFDAEKLLWRSVADSREEVDNLDVASVHGFRSMTCQGFEPTGAAMDTIFPF